jgi:hypothetical protein
MPVEWRLGSLSLSYVDSPTAGRSPVSQASTAADMGSGKPYQFGIYGQTQDSRNHGRLLR